MHTDAGDDLWARMADFICAPHPYVGRPGSSTGAAVALLGIAPSAPSRQESCPLTPCPPRERKIPAVTRGGHGDG
jgi:hypothetical protein